MLRHSHSLYRRVLRRIWDAADAEFQQHQLHRWDDYAIANFLTQWAWRGYGPTAWRRAFIQHVRLKPEQYFELQAARRRELLLCEGKTRSAPAPAPLQLAFDFTPPRKAVQRERRLRQARHSRRLA